MPENLLCPNHRATTPAFRKGWDKTFNTIPSVKTEMPNMKRILEHVGHKSVGYHVVVEKGRLTAINKFKGEA